MGVARPLPLVGRLRQHLPEHASLGQLAIILAGKAPGVLKVHRCLRCPWRCRWPIRGVGARRPAIKIAMTYFPLLTRGVVAMLHPPAIRGKVAITSGVPDVVKDSIWRRFQCRLR